MENVGGYWNRDNTMNSCVRMAVVKEKKRKCQVAYSFPFYFYFFIIILHFIHDILCVYRLTFLYVCGSWNHMDFGADSPTRRSTKYTYVYMYVCM